MSPLTPEQLDKYVETEYTAALEIYRASNPLVRSGSKNFFACVELMQVADLAPEYFHRNAFLSALAQCAANGTLDRELNAEEKAERERRINIQREQRDRADGNVGTARGRLTEREQEQLELEGRKQLLDTLKAVQQKVNAEISGSEAQAELSASDALYALTGGDPSIPFTREKVLTWLDKWPADLCRSVRRRQEGIRERIDEVLKGNPDPMTGVENV